MTTSNGLREILVTQTRKLYDAESQISAVLPKMAFQVHSRDLSKALYYYNQLTNLQLDRLYQVFELMEEPPVVQECEGMRNLIHNTWEYLMYNTDQETLDTGLLLYMQQFNLYQLSGYRASMEFSRTIGTDCMISNLLKQSIYEKNKMDENYSIMKDEIIKKINLPHKVTNNPGPGKF